METRNVSSRVDAAPGGHTSSQKQSLVQPLRDEFRLLMLAARGPVTPEGSKCHWNSTEMHLPPAAGPEPGHRREAEAPGMDAEATAQEFIDPLELELSGAWSPVTQAADPIALGRSAPPGPLEAVLACELVKRVQWGGDRRRGMARIELAAGAVIVLGNEGREVTLDITLPPGDGADGLAERLSKRLEARGILVTAVTVR